MPGYYVLFICFGFIFLFGCTENPFSDEEKISQNAISGRVALENHPDPGNVFIWFEVLNISARADSTGRFSLHIPTPAKQPGGGIDGIYDLHFYAANYQLKTVKIAMAKGKVQYDDQALNNNGELKETVVLTEILNINTSFSQRTVSESLVDTIYATFTVYAKENPVQIKIDSSSPDYPGDPEFMTGFLLNAKKSFVKALKREDKGHRTVTITIGSSAGALKRLPILIPRGEIPSGSYYVIPYILIEQDLPAGLIENIGQNVTKYSQDFLKIPLKLFNNKLTI